MEHKSEPCDGQHAVPSIDHNRREGQAASGDDKCRNGQCCYLHRRPAQFHGQHQEAQRDRQADRRSRSRPKPGQKGHGREAKEELLQGEAEQQAGRPAGQRRRRFRGEKPSVFAVYEESQEDARDHSTHGQTCPTFPARGRLKRVDRAVLETPRKNEAPHDEKTPSEHAGQNEDRLGATGPKHQLRNTTKSANHGRQRGPRQDVWTGKITHEASYSGGESR
jgi:hypothetical protein